MVNGLPVANFLPLLVLLLLFLKPNLTNLLTAYGTSTWMLFIWILLLATVLPLVAFDIPSFWWTGALGTIGHLVLRLCPWIASFRRSVSFGLPLVPSHGVSIVTAIPSFLELPLVIISSIMTPKLLLPLPSVSHQIRGSTEKFTPQKFSFNSLTPKSVPA
jgi:hypothetical protein